MFPAAAQSDEILFLLAGRARWPLRDLCEALGVTFPSERRWSRTLHRQLAAVSATLQQLKRAGRVRHVRAQHASGWELCA